MHVYIQCNPSKTDTIGKITFVLYKLFRVFKLIFFNLSYIIARREINSTLQVLLMQ